MWFRFAYLLVIILCVTPTLPGLAGVFSVAFNWFPAIGLHHPSADAFLSLWYWPGIGRSVALTIVTSLVSTYGAAILCFAVLQRCFLHRHWGKVETLLAPLLSMPHVAFAIGFAFLFSPTGLIARWVTQVTGIPLDTSQATWLIHDPYGLGLTLALALKEMPFLLLMSIPVLQQLNLKQHSHSSHSLGYSEAQFWWKVILPQWLVKMRFPLFAVLAYGVAVVDLSLILGPKSPPTLALWVWQWFNDPDIKMLPQAAAGAVTLFGLLSFLMLVIVVGEKLLTRTYRQWQFSGRSGLTLPGIKILTLCAMLTISTLPVLLLWSFALRWPFPELLPTRFTDRFWISQWQPFVPTLTDSLIIAVICASLALILAAIAQQYRQHHRWYLPGYVLVLPMLIPQLSLLLGLQVAALTISHQSYYLWVIWSHLFFAFPFVYLALEGAWRSYNRHYSQIALSLGKSPFRTFFSVKVRILAPALFYAWALGASVSLAQYLPTLMLGAGRITTVTTEAVALSSGSDRRVTAIYALWQAVLPFAFFSLALLLGKSRRGQLAAHSYKTQEVTKS